MTANRSPIVNPTAEAILGFARSREDPQVMLGFDGDDGYAFIQVDYSDPGAPMGYNSEVWPFDSHEAALAVFLDLRNRMADLRRGQTFRCQLRAFRAADRARVDIGPDWFAISVCNPPATPLVSLSFSPIQPDRRMKDERSLERLVEAVEQFIRTEGL